MFCRLVEAVVGRLAHFVPEDANFSEAVQGRKKTEPAQPGLT